MKGSNNKKVNNKYATIFTFKAEKPNCAPNKQNLGKVLSTTLDNI